VGGGEAIAPRGVDFRPVTNDIPMPMGAASPAGPGFARRPHLSRPAGSQMPNEAHFSLAAGRDQDRIAYPPSQRPGRARNRATSKTSPPGWDHTATDTHTRSVPAGPEIKRHPEVGTPGWARDSTMPKDEAPGRTTVHAMPRDHSSGRAKDQATPTQDAPGRTTRLTTPKDDSSGRANDPAKPIGDTPGRDCPRRLGANGPKCQRHQQTGPAPAAATARWPARRPRSPCT
jgi:hypothetical protein